MNGMPLIEAYCLNNFVVTVKLTVIVKQ